MWVVYKATLQITRQLWRQAVLEMFRNLNLHVHETSGNFLSTFLFSPLVKNIKVNKNFRMSIFSSSCFLIDWFVHCCDILIYLHVTQHYIVHNLSLSENFKGSSSAALFLTKFENRKKKKKTPLCRFCELIDLDFYTTNYSIREQCGAYDFESLHR